MRAAVVTKDHKVSIEDKKLRALKPGEALYKRNIVAFVIPIYMLRMLILVMLQALL